MMSDVVTDRDIVVFLAELMGTLKRASDKYAYVGDMRYTFSFNGDIVKVSKLAYAGHWRDMDTREDAG